MALYRSEHDFLHSLKLFNTLSSAKYHWHSGKSSKEHNCEFGHVIPPEHLYFKKPLDSEGENKIRVCKECMEKLIHLTVDCDAQSKEFFESIFLHNNPKPKTITRKARS
jgi:hypothetical protein